MNAYRQGCFCVTWFQTNSGGNIANLMDQDDGERPDQFVRSILGTSARKDNETGSLSQLKSLTGVDSDVIIVSDDADDVGDDRLASWQCTDCKAVNVTSASCCISCHALPNPGRLPIEGATMNGEKSSGDDKSKTEAMDADVWSCCRCTLRNAAKNTRCEVCEAPKRSVLYNHVFELTPSQLPQRAATNADELGSVDKAPTSSLAVDKTDSTTGSGAAASSADWAVWTCSNCTYNNNPSWANLCDVCEDVKQCSSSQTRTAVGKAAVGKKPGIKKGQVATTWQCTECGTANANSVCNCDYCDVQHKKVSAAKDKDMWTCSRCTLRNSSVAHVCAVCQSKRDTVLPQADDIDSHWPCPKCMCLNRSSQNFCEACEHHRPGVVNRATNDPLPGGSTSDVRRQSSVFVHEQQLKEEMAARDQWMQIVSFCKVASTFFTACFSPVLFIY